jgi:cytochrome c5
MKSLNAAATMILTLLLVGPACVHAQALDSGAAAASSAQKADPPRAVNGYGATEAQQKRHLELFRLGATLWPIYCNHCHQAPNPEEQAPYQWDQIMMHMRTLENLPPQDEKAILEYLKTAR